MNWLRLASTLFILSFFKGAISINSNTAKLCESKGGPFNCELFGSPDQNMFMRGFELFFIGHTFEEDLNSLDYSGGNNLACFVLESSSCSFTVTPGDYEGVPEPITTLLRHLMENCHNQKSCIVEAPNWAEVATVFPTGSCSTLGTVGMLGISIHFECGFPTTTTTTTTAPQLSTEAQSSQSNTNMTSTLIGAPSGAPTSAPAEVANLTLVTTETATTKPTVLPAVPESTVGLDNTQNGPITEQSVNSFNAASSSALADIMIVTFTSVLCTVYWLHIYL